jgi:hypothetical protein
MDRKPPLPAVMQNLTIGHWVARLTCVAAKLKLALYRVLRALASVGVKIFSSRDIISNERLLLRPTLSPILFLFLASALIAELVNPLTSQSHNETTKITVRFNPGYPITRFVPSYAFGAALDGHEKGEVDHMLSPKNVNEMLTAGLKPLSYRLRTELAVEAWHWNPQGTWSERGRRQGYWTSRVSGKTGRSISLSYGYRLPRRGSTIDQANDDGYSRLDDGDRISFWKSNPYLDQHFTGEQNSKLPQWVLIDLGTEKSINAIQLNWAQPYARVYDVEYGHFSGGDDISQSLPDVWQTFPLGRVVASNGGKTTLRLSPGSVTTRFVRVLMKESSGTSMRHSADVRDHLGYAIREISLGTLNTEGNFRDEMQHAPNNGNQTLIYVSSTDPWHREVDKDNLIEQPGFDRVFQSALTNRLPMLIPVPLLYDTPENAAVEIGYLKARGYSVERVELGEEPDGQFVSPEDYAALYIQFAKAIHAVDPKLKLGGPSFQDIEPGEKVGLTQTGKPYWLQRFLAHLKERGSLNEYTFFSFEWYPFDDVCQPTAPQMKEATQLLKDSLAQMEDSGLTRAIPWIITEYGYSAFGGQAEMDIEGALLNADIVATFLTLGGQQTFLYGYEPNEIIQEDACSSGNNMLFLLGADGTIRYRMPTYYGARLLTQDWAQPGDGLHELYLATVDKPALQDTSLVTAYPVLRPDGMWAVMVLNKDSSSAHTVEVRFHNEATGSESEFEGVIDLYQYSRKQYELSANKEDPYPIKDDPPAHWTLKGSKNLVVEVPAYSLTIIRGKGPLPTH